VVDGLGQQGIASPGDVMGEFDFLGDDPNATVVMPRTRKRPQPKADWKTLGIAAAVVAGVSAVVAFAIIGVAGLVVPAASAVIGYESPSERAIEDAREHVRDQLLSPRSAIFADDCKVKKINDRFFIVSSHVDAHNAFGTHVRHQWRTRVRYEDDGSVSFTDTVIY
jgi:hypothetical protein